MRMRTKKLKYTKMNENKEFLYKIQCLCTFQGIYLHIRGGSSFPTIINVMLGFGVKFWF